MTDAAPAPDGQSLSDSATASGRPAPDKESAADRVRRPLVKFLTLAWVPLTASFLSLILSVTAILLSTQQPEVLLVMPDQIRIVQGRQSGSAFVYLQPAFVSTGRNERVEVIRDMTLQVQSTTAEPVDFVWTEQVRLVGNASSNGLSYEYAGDAVPLLVNARSAASPVCLFDAPDGFFFAVGTYTFTLTAVRVVASDALAGTFSVTIGPDAIAFLERPGPEQFLTFDVNQ